MSTRTSARSKSNKDTNEKEANKYKSPKRNKELPVESPSESSIRRRRTRSSGSTHDDHAGAETPTKTPNKLEEDAVITKSSRSSSKSLIATGGNIDDKTMPPIFNINSTDSEAVKAITTPEKNSKRRASSSEKKEKKSGSTEKKKSSSSGKKKSLTPAAAESDVPGVPKKTSRSSSKKKKRIVEGDATTLGVVTASAKDSNKSKKSDHPETDMTTSIINSKKSEPTLDVLVHRLRHLNYHPKPILAMASTSVVHGGDTVDDAIVVDTVNQQPQRSTTTTTNKPPESYIAISRESGCLELQTIHPKWRTLAVIAGHTSTPITLLTWIQCPTIIPQDDDDEQVPEDRSEHEIPMAQRQSPPHRPVLVGVNGADLYIVDFWDRQQLISKYECSGGSIFSLQHIQDNILAIGSQDGTIRILAVIDMTFESISTIPTAGAAVLSLACISNSMNAATKRNDIVGTILFAGVADGTIRRYDCHPSHNHQSMGTSSANVTTSAKVYFASSSAGVVWRSTLRMTVECYGRSTPTLVWTMKALSDGIVVSGDSLGHVQFWDGLTGTLISTFDQNDNKADVLALDVTSDECKVFSSGVDSRVICIERRRNVSGSNDSDDSKWMMTHAQRPHTHDVKAMTVMKKFKVNHSGKITKQTEILFTGGIDTKLCTYHVSEFGLRRPRSLYPWPSLHSPIVAANKAKIITMLREDLVDLYELATAPSSPKQLHAPIVASDEQSHIGTIHVKGSSNLSCCAINDSGTFLALCDSYSVFLFHLQTETTKSGKKKVTASTIPITLPDFSSMVAIQFIQDSRLVLATSDSRIFIYSMGKDDNANQPSHVQTFAPSNTDTDRLGLLLPIHSIISSNDGLWMATARNSCDQSDGKIDIYRSGLNDSYHFWWSLPSLNASVSVASFLSPEMNQTMAVACVNFTWYIFDIAQRCLSDWSVKAGYPLSSNKIPNDLAARNDYPIRISTNPANPSVLLIGSFGAIVVVNTAESFPKRCRIFPETHVRGTKRKRSNSHSESNNSLSELSPSCTICLSYNSMLFMNFVDRHEMVVVEQPWLSVVASFPGALQRKVYGT